MSSVTHTVSGSFLDVPAVRVILTGKKIHHGNQTKKLSFNGYPETPLYHWPLVWCSCKIPQLETQSTYSVPKELKKKKFIFDWAFDEGSSQRNGELPMSIRSTITESTLFQREDLILLVAYVTIIPSKKSRRSVYSSS
ncbi:hypothetical protein CDAR_504191 [Caerostris darwini]|uniref:Uncharacterized protein n=1 Tax=Caerostris darwini TaxID=1538125 RepID=A0AAV4S2T2_9ARAC|nr:hypothetical protein CDAR_504191 [Caerostris darwini]